MSRVVLSLGSNLGDRRRHLSDAVAALRDRPPVSVEAVSAIYRTPPWGPIPQRDYYNIAVVATSSELDSYGWLARCRELEEAAGRIRDIRWGPRTLDADVIAVDDLVSDDPDLVLPHPRAHERAFVLVPWVEVEPGATLPGHGSIADLLERLDLSDIAAVGHLG